MAKLSPNAPCPCHSGQKYKKCCQRYHKGANASTPLLLMRSRYSAYALGLSGYIIKTTHPDNPDYTTDTKAWAESIALFTQESHFLGLKILEVAEGEKEGFVTFEATLSSGLLHEKSRFIRHATAWLYVDGVID